MAKNAEIQGKINATSGKIGGWDITSTGIHGKDSNGNNISIEPTQLLVGDGSGGGPVPWYNIYTVAKDDYERITKLEYTVKEIIRKYPI